MKGVRLAGRSAALAEVNQGILEVACDSRFEEQAWDFFCECGEEECHEYVLLAVDAYVRLHDSGGAVLADGHMSSDRPVEDEMAVEPVRVLVVDDNEACRKGLAEVVSTAEQFTLAGCAGSGEEALQLLPRLDPHLVLLDVRMPGLDGPQTARRILTRQPQAVVVLVSAEPDLESLAASCGATKFLPKSEVSPRRLSDVWAQTRARAAKARREAHALQEDVRAVKAQAKHQTQRATKNLTPPESDP
ncbi:MAG: response regulator transcription factor [Solirubrobacteraceae bacterium]